MSKTSYRHRHRKPLQEGVDYYLENGLYVFTEHFLRNRGYCCRTGCRHCPYGFREEQEKARGNDGPEAGKTSPGSSVQP